MLVFLCSNFDRKTTIDQEITYLFFFDKYFITIKNWILRLAFD